MAGPGGRAGKCEAVLRGTVSIGIRRPFQCDGRSVTDDYFSSMTARCPFCDMAAGKPETVMELEAALAFYISC
jgi:hypothetical protein